MGFSTITSSIIIFSIMILALIIMSSMMFNSWYRLVNALSEKRDLFVKNIYVIDSINVSCNGTIIKIKIKNKGPRDLWDFYSSELILNYINQNYTKVTYILKYKVDWNITYVESGANILNYTEGMGLYPGESALLEVVLRDPALLNGTFTIIFIDQYGSITYYRMSGGGACA